MRLSQRLPRETGRDYALRILKENIISLELPPGSPISENEVAAELSLSRTPVREAFIELARVRILVTAPQKRSVVALIDYDLVEEARFMRYVLEVAVAELDCKMVRPDDITRLRENVRLQKYYLENRDPEQIMRLDDELHRMLFEIAKKPQVLEQIRNISIHFDRVRQMSLTSVRDLKIVQEHEEIVEAIAAGDAELARARMDTHLRRYQVDAADIRAHYPAHYFKPAGC